MSTKYLTRNAILAAVYAGVALMLPATALANYRLSTALYVLAAWDRRLIPGLIVGNALAGLPQGPIDVAMGAIVGALTSYACALLGERLAPVAVLVVPTLVVPTWLGWLFGVPYMAVLPVLLQGQAASAVLGWLLQRSAAIRRIVRGE